MSSTVSPNTFIAHSGQKPSKFRYILLLLIAVVTINNYADRAILSIASTSTTHDFNLLSKDLGIVFSTFDWAYAIEVGSVESPAFPASSRILANWFPTKEIGFASSVFNSS